MPPKKQLQLQVTLETQEQWETLVAKEGLSVIDVYSAWCGPCKAVSGLFRRVKNEIGDELLRFAIAKADTIDALEPYRGHSEPTFLMFSAGVLVAVIRGALGPQLERTVKEQLEYEHQVLDGKAERKPVVDEGLNQPEVILEEDQIPEPEPEPEIVPTKKQFTVLLIKPDAVRAGKADEIVERVEAKGLEVLVREERQLSKEEAAEFYKQHEGSEHFEELCEFMSSGPCMLLVLTKGEAGEGVVGELREFIGPTDVEKAKEEVPDSLRAQYGTDSKMNALHASDSQDTAARELAFFLPRFNVPWVRGMEPLIERTLALIRPDALAQHGDAILEKIREAGFEIAIQKKLTLTKEQAAEFYKEHEEKDYFDSLCTHMSSGPMMALCLAREEAVQGWRDALGPADIVTALQEVPESLRAQFPVEDHNALHGSSSVDDAAKELQYFFPKEQTVAVIKPTAISEKDLILSKIRESGFTVSLSKETTLTKEMAELLYSNQKGKEFFDELTNMMSSGPSLFMVLSREDAVVGWRGLMGPTDPEDAKQQDPNSLRALFGVSALANAVHGSSSTDQAHDEIETIFGKVEFNPNGNVKDEGEGSSHDVVQEGETTAEATST